VCHTISYPTIYLTPIYAIEYPIQISSLTSLGTFNRRLPCRNINDTPVYTQVKYYSGIPCACGFIRDSWNTCHPPLGACGCHRRRSAVALVGANSVHCLPRVHSFVWFLVTPWGRFTYTAVEILVGYYWLGGLLLVRESLWRSRSVPIEPYLYKEVWWICLIITAWQVTRLVGKVCNLCRVKTDISVVLTIKSGLDLHMST